MKKLLPLCSFALAALSAALIEIHFTLAWIKNKEKVLNELAWWLIYRNISTRWEHSCSLMGLTMGEEMGNYSKLLLSRLDINNARLYLNVLFLSFIFIHSSTLEGISLRFFPSFSIHAAAERACVSLYNLRRVLIQLIQPSAMRETDTQHWALHEHDDADDDI